MYLGLSLPCFECIPLSAALETYTPELLCSNVDSRSESHTADYRLHLAFRLRLTYPQSVLFYSPFLVYVLPSGRHLLALQYTSIRFNSIVVKLFPVTVSFPLFLDSSLARMGLGHTVQIQLPCFIWWAIP